MPPLIVLWSVLGLHVSGAIMSSGDTIRKKTGPAVEPRRSRSPKVASTRRIRTIVKYLTADSVRLDGVCGQVESTGDALDAGLIALKAYVEYKDDSPFPIHGHLEDSEFTIIGSRIMDACKRFLNNR